MKTVMEERGKKNWPFSKLGNDDVYATENITCKETFA